MGKFVQRDVYISIANTNGTFIISNYANKCEVSDTADKIDFTGFSANGYKEFGQGLRDGDIKVTLFNDFVGTTTPYALIQPLYASGGTFNVEIRPTSAARSTSNPAILMTARVYSFSPLQGGPGDASSFDVDFANASLTGLQYATA